MQKVVWLVASYEHLRVVKSWCPRSTFIKHFDWMYPTAPRSRFFKTLVSFGFPHPVPRFSWYLDHHPLHPLPLALYCIWSALRLRSYLIFWSQINETSEVGAVMCASHMVLFTDSDISAVPQFMFPSCLCAAALCWTLGGDDLLRSLYHTCETSSKALLLCRAVYWSECLRRIFLVPIHSP